MLLCVCLLATNAFAQFPNTGATVGQEDVDQAQEYWRGVSETLLRNARRLVTPTLGVAERDVESQINYRVAASGNMNALAYLDGGRRYVQLRSMTTQIFGWIATAESMAAETNNEACFLAYMKYFGSNVLQNSRATSAGVKKISYEPLLAISKGLVPECGAPVTTYERIVANERAYIAKQAEASFLLLWLHEVGHHVLGHVDNPNVSLVERRRRESDADEWAIRTITNANQFASVGRPFFYFVTIFQGMSLADEERSTHPLGTRRTRDIVSAITPAVRSNSQLMSFLRQRANGEEEYFKTLSEMQAQAASMIPRR